MYRILQSIHHIVYGYSLNVTYSYQYFFCIFQTLLYAMLLPEDKRRIKSLLTDAIKLMCKNGLPCNADFNIEGLIGITMEKDEVLLVSINEKVCSSPLVQDEEISESIPFTEFDGSYVSGPRIISSYSLSSPGGQDVSEDPSSPDLSNSQCSHYSNEPQSSARRSKRKRKQSRQPPEEVVIKEEIIEPITDNIAGEAEIVDDTLGNSDDFSDEAPGNVADDSSMPVLKPVPPLLRELGTIAVSREEDRVPAKDTPVKSSRKGQRKKKPRVSSVTKQQKSTPTPVNMKPTPRTERQVQSWQ